MKRMNRKICRWLVVSIFFCLSIYKTIGAQEQRPVKLTLSDAIQTAVKNNPKISAAASQVEATDSQVVQARSGLIPQINFREAYSHTNNPMWAFGTKLNQEVITQQDFDPAKLNNPDAVDNFASILSLNWSLYDSGQTWYGWKQAKLAKKTAELFMKRTRQQIIAQTVNAYVGLLLTQKNLSVIEQALATARSHQKMVQSRYESGFIVKSDLLRSQVHIADLEQQLLQADSQVQVARAFLNAAMGVAIDDEYDLITPLEMNKEIEGTLENWLDTALSRRPDMEQLRHQESIAREEITKSRHARLPSVNLVGSYEWNTEDFNEWGDNYTLGAVVNVNLFSGHRLSAKIVQAKAELKQVNAQQQDLKQSILVQTRQAFLQAQSSRRRIQVAQVAVVQAEETLRIVRNRYESGLLTIVALLDAELALLQAQTNLFNSIHDYTVAAFQLALAAGTIDETID